MKRLWRRELPEARKELGAAAFAGAEAVVRTPSFKQATR